MGQVHFKRSVTLEEAVRDRRWDRVADMLAVYTYIIRRDGNTETNEEIMRWAVEEACKQATDEEFVDILIYCEFDQINTVLSKAVERGLWKSVKKLLLAIEHARVSGFSDTQRWAVEEACKHATDGEFSQIAVYCENDQINSLLTEAVQRGLWKSVKELLVLTQDCSPRVAIDTQRWAVEETCERAANEDFKKIASVCAYTHLNSVLTEAVKRGLWYTVGHVIDRIRKTGVPGTSDTQSWAVEEACKRAGDELLMNVSYYVSITHLASIMTELYKRGLDRAASQRLNIELRYKATDEVLSVWARLFLGTLSKESEDIQRGTLQISEATQRCNDTLFSQTLKWLELERNARQNFTNVKAEVWSKMRTVFSSTSGSSRDGDVCAHYFEWCLKKRGIKASLSQIALALIASQTVYPALQRLARTSMWEETRRWYLQFIVEEKLWDIVKELADHSLYDDQRGWALGQALYDKQWDVMVVLADHGLTDEQLRKVYRLVAKHADWHTVRQLFERGVDMRVVCEELMAANPSRERPPSRERIERLRNMGEDVTELEAEYRERCEHYAKIEADHKRRCKELARLETELSESNANIEILLGNRKWYAVLCTITQNASQKRIEMTLQHAIQHDAWHVVMQLVRLGMNTAQRDSLFSEVIRRRQWGVGRALLERCVSVELSRAALPQLMEADQWILVARVMELSLDDTERRRVMQAALDKKEGSVVAHGISVMEGRLSVEEREVMYDQALSQGVWQAVKRLVEEKDDTGMTQSDKALVTAVEQHRWDMVDHCDKHGADINKRDAQGNTLLHVKTNRGDWDRVNGLLHHGADPNLPDRKGYSALHHAVVMCVSSADVDQRRRWKDITTFVKFHGNISLQEPCGQTPLHKFIFSTCRTYYANDPVYCADVLDCALTWGGDVDWTENYNGMTALHVLCQAGLWDSMRYIVARGGNPLAVTDGGKTVLTVAVEYDRYEMPYGYRTPYRWEEVPRRWEAEVRECRQKLAAECIRMGISTHQPHVTDKFYSKSISPVYISIEKRDIVVLHMLYESGACSHRELHRVFHKPPSPSRPPEVRTWKYAERFADYQKEEARYTQCMSYLDNIACNPRSLQSLCRLVISHHLGIWTPRRYQRRVKQLPLPDPMKSYVMFSELVAPDYGKHMVLQEEETEQEKTKQRTMKWAQE